MFKKGVVLRVKHPNNYQIMAAVLPAIIAVCLPADASGSRQAETYMRQGMYDEAVVEYKKALKTDPDNADIRLDYARALAANTLYERSAAEYRKVMETHPERAGIALELADILEHTAGDEQAIDLYVKYLDADAENAPVRLRLARAYMNFNNSEAAEHEFRQVLERLPENIPALLGLSDCLSGKNRHEQAGNYLEQALRIAPEDGRVLFALGWTYMKMNRSSEAVEMLRRAKEIDPQHPRISYFLARSLAQEGHYKEAISRYYEALKDMPEYRNIRVELAAILLPQGRYREVIDVLSVDGPSGRINHQRGFLLAAAYACLNDFPSFWRQIKDVRFAAAGLLFGAVMIVAVMLGLLALLFAAVRVLGRKRGEKQLRFTQVSWSLKDAFLVCAGLFLLPLVIAVIVGGLWHGNWFVIFFPAESISSSSVQTAISAQIIAMAVILLAIFRIARRNNHPAAVSLGIVPVGFRRLIVLTVLGLSVIFAFSMVYFAVYSLITGGIPDSQYISKVISSSQTAWETVPLFVFVVLIGPAAEELIFRGFIFSALRRCGGFAVSAAVSSLLFGVFHFHWNLLLPIAFMGFVFAALFERTRSILPAVTVHILWNLFSFGSIFS